jgi:hypothetical protein
MRTGDGEDPGLKTAADCQWRQRRQQAGSSENGGELKKGDGGAGRRYKVGDGGVGGKDSGSDRDGGKS